MTQSSESGPSNTDLRQRIDALDAGIHTALIERGEVVSALIKARQEEGRSNPVFAPAREADIMRQVLERHHGTVPLASMEHLWRAIIGSVPGPDAGQTLYLDGSAELIEMLDLARFYFGFSAELVPCSDTADVVGAVSETSGALGLVALIDRAELPWWRGLNEAGAQIRGRLPFVVLEDRPADLPALVLAKAESLIDNTDVAVYDARWSDLLPGKLMDQGIEVLSFFRSANGVDALLAVSGNLPEDDVLKACADAGAAPETLRRVGGYETPIDAGSDPDDVFDPKDEVSQG